MIVLLGKETPVSFCVPFIDKYSQLKSILKTYMGLPIYVPVSQTLIGMKKTFSEENHIFRNTCCLGACFTAGH